ncbi:Hpt domain-containing protein [Alteromonas gracilis]|uniref:Hpt domain-containing protein n=1 Tax=Alteromonas gracilis TaxID=1479524 RepID=UPI0030CFD20A
MTPDELANQYSNSELWNKTAALSRLAGNEALLARIVDMFVEQIGQKQETLQSAIRANDGEAIRFQSHSIKGIAGDVGADALRTKAAEMEQLANLGVLEDMPDHMSQLNVLVSSTILLMQQ